MKSLSLPLALTGFLVMPVSAEMYSPVASHTRAAVMVSNQKPRTGDSHVVPPNHDRPGQSDPARPREAEAVLRLEEELSSRENQPGDVFYAEVVDDVLAANGLVLVPLGSRVRGHLAGNGNGQLEEIRLVIDAIIVDEWEIPVTARVVETNPYFRHGQSPTEAAAKVAAGDCRGERSWVGSWAEMPTVPCTAVCREPQWGRGSHLSSATGSPCSLPARGSSS